MGTEKNSRKSSDDRVLDTRIMFIKLLLSSTKKILQQGRKKAEIIRRIS